MDVVGILVAVVAVLGLIFYPSLLYVWVFPLVFGLAPCPDRARRRFLASRADRT